MKVLRAAFVFLLGLTWVAPVVAQTTTTTVFLVRHAEKGGDPTDRDPELSEAGWERARVLAHALGEAGVSAIYSTPFLRTQHTAQPLAEMLGIDVSITPATRTLTDDTAKAIREHQAGSVLLVVGHSNTIPPLVNALAGTSYENLQEHEYEDLFVVTIASDGSATAIRMRYGQATP